MASFYAELHVAGYCYPVRVCTYSFSQATDARGRVVAKVRPGLIYVTLDVPNGDFLLVWAATAHKPLAGYLIFSSTRGGPALETLSWEAGHCVGYQEEFRSGNKEEGAYVCHLTIAAAQLTLREGGPGDYLSPAPGTPGRPVTALVNPLVVPLLTPAPIVAPLVETVVEATVLTVLTPVVLILALILGSSTPAGGPGIPQPHGLPIDPDVLRLNTLLAKHAASTLVAGEEAELIALLAKVKGIRVKSLADLNVIGSYKKQPQTLPGFHFEEITYTKRSEADTEVLRRKFKSSVRSSFMKKISSEPAYIRELRMAGFENDDLDLMQLGRVPDDWQVHHKLPLDDGGDNGFHNLLLIKNTPYHSMVTGYQKTNTGKSQPGQSKQLRWPTYSQGIV